MAKKAILVVSFGTSVNATREKTIDRIEADIQKAMPDRVFYRAWTSGMIIRKIEKRDDTDLISTAGSMCRGTAPANSSSSGTKLRPSPEARSEASTGTPDVPCTCRPAAATSSMHRNSSRMQQKSSQNLQQPKAIEINCAAMTWSERSELRVSAGAYTASVRIQTIHRA